MQFLVKYHHTTHGWHMQHNRREQLIIVRSVAVHGHGGHSSTGELTASPTHRQRWMWTGVPPSSVPCGLLQLQENTVWGENNTWISGFHKLRLWLMVLRCHICFLFSNTARGKQCCSPRLSAVHCAAADRLALIDPRHFTPRCILPLQNMHKQHFHELK